MPHRHQFHQLDPCGECGVDYKIVTPDFAGFSESRLSCFLT